VRNAIYEVMLGNVANCRRLLEKRLGYHGGVNQASSGSMHLQDRVKLIVRSHGPVLKVSKGRRLVGVE
jgi:hypothetical protein